MVRPVNAADGPQRWYYSVEQAAERLQVSRKVVRDMIDFGQLPGVRLGRSVVVPQAALESWLDTAISASVAS
jgi:excisionase family DNA binding protein